MNLIELFKNRYSVRKFTSQKVEKEKIDAILEAGKLAPTAVNYQPQRIFVIESEESLEKLKSVTPYHFNSPLAFLICYDNTVSWKNPFDNKDEGIIDASIVTTHMMLEITNLGLGSTWVGYFDPKNVKTVYNLPDNIVPVAILPVGYPDKDPSNLHNERLDLSKTVKYL